MVKFVVLRARDCETHRLNAELTGSLLSGWPAVGSSTPARASRRAGLCVLFRLRTQYGTGAAACISAACTREPLRSEEPLHESAGPGVTR